jgi:hypothetical protein
MPSTKVSSGSVGSLREEGRGGGGGKREEGRGEEGRGKRGEGRGERGEGKREEGKREVGKREGRGERAGEGRRREEEGEGRRGGRRRRECSELREPVMREPAGDAGSAASVCPAASRAGSWWGELPA